MGDSWDTQAPPTVVLFPRMPILRLTGLLFLAATSLAQQPAAPVPDAPAAGQLPSGSAAICPDQPGTRTFRSQIFQDRANQAEIIGSATRTANGCEYKAELKITKGGATNTIVFEDPDKQNFSIVDFSPDGNSLLLASQLPREFPNEVNRQVAIAIFPLGRHNIVWHNAWDIFGWHDCDASVEPQGFDSHGNVIVRTQPSHLLPKHRADCVADGTLNAVSIAEDTVERVPDSTPVLHPGRQVEAAKTARAAN